LLKLVFAVLILAGCSNSSQPQTVADLAELDGSKVTVNLHKSFSPEQHPMLSGPSLSGEEERRQMSVTLDSDPKGSELVILCQEQIPCESFQVTGTVSMVRMGGDKGKETYQRPWIHVSLWHCN